VSDRPAPDGDPAPLELLPIPAPTAVPARARSERAVEATDALARYMGELRLHAPISRDEEQALAVRWRDLGDLDAARSLVLANLRLVVKIAMEYRRSWTNLLDLIQEGNVGLMQAVKRFDPEQGVKLSSYAAYWIRAYILKYLIDNIRIVRLGSTRAERKLFFRLNKEKRELERHGFEVEPKLLAERLDVTEQDVLSMEQRLAEGEVSFDAPLLGEDSDRTLGDLVSAGAASAEDEVGNRELREVFLSKVKEFAAGLEPRERQIVEQRILAEEPRTLQELGDEFGVTRERVRQLEARLVKRLREYLQREVVDFEYYAPEE
jgi:RNA polymerase sigma-32 factor